MTVIHSEFATALREILVDAEEVWIAVALINDGGFSQIQDLISENCIQHYLVGIDLPTSSTVLRTLKQHIVPNKFEAKIYKSSNMFHPKIYIAKSDNGYKAIVGSANLTNGGLNNNIEMSVLLDGVACTDLLEWFDQLYGPAYPLTDENIQSYEQSIARIGEDEREIKRKRASVVLTKPSLVEGPLKPYLESIDFTNKFFKYKHFWAFRRNNWRNDSAEANNERFSVVERLLELHERIFPQFQEYGLVDLHKHFREANVTSSYFHTAYTEDELKSIWLHYSKEEQEIKRYEQLFYGLGKIQLLAGDRNEMGFANQIRLQVIVHSKDLGVWLYIGKRNNGSPFDREHIKSVLQNSASAHEFYSMIKSLPSGYYMAIEEERHNCSEFEQIEDFVDFWHKDSPRLTSYIGVDFELESAELMTERFPSAVLENFALLYPIYQLLRDKRFAQ